MECADAADLTHKLSKHFGAGSSVKGPIAPPPFARIASNGTASTSAATNGTRSKQSAQEALTSRLEQLVHSAPVMLFMKGSPAAPRCGFSAKVVDALRQASVDFQHFDILSNDAVRQGLKVMVHTCAPLQSSQFATLWGSLSSGSQTPFSSALVSPIFGHSLSFCETCYNTCCKTMSWHKALHSCTWLGMKTSLRSSAIAACL